jgi:hypothetical protein
MRMVMTERTGSSGANLDHINFENASVGSALCCAANLLGQVPLELALCGNDSEEVLTVYTVYCASNRKINFGFNERAVLSSRR